MILAINKFTCALTMAVVSAVFGKFSGFAKDWCNIEGCPGMENLHPFCLYPDIDEKYTPVCNNSRSTTTENLTRHLTDLYNDFRNRWARGKWPNQKENNFTMVSNMRVMYYDYELEALALRLALNCATLKGTKFPHLCNRFDRFPYSMLSGFFRSSQRNETDEVISIKHFHRFTMGGANYTKPELMRNYTLGHKSSYPPFLSRMLWASTRSFAFSEAFYTDVNNEYGLTLYSRMVISVYAPPSNIIGESVYLEGFPGENCPIGTVIFYDPRYPYLCGGDTNITEIIYYLPIGGQIDNLPNATDTKKIFGNSSNHLLSDVLGVVIFFCLIMLLAPI